MASEPDGTLLDWDVISNFYRWETLLVGNGLSQNVWEPFGYRNLYDHAKDGGLTAEDKALFADTPNSSGYWATS